MVSDKEPRCGTCAKPLPYCRCHEGLYVVPGAAPKAGTKLTPERIAEHFRSLNGLVDAKELRGRIEERRRETYARLEGKVLGLGVISEEDYLAKICDAVYEDVLREIDGASGAPAEGGKT